MLKRPNYIALGLVLVLVLVILNLPSQTATQLKLALGSLFVPLFGLAGSAHSLAERTGNALAPRESLISQLEQLRRENQEFRVRQQQVAEIQRENERLRQALNWRRQAPWKLRLARVILRDPANWWRTVQIDVGLRDGVTANLPVLTPEGLVGKIKDVGAGSARVALVGDPECKVSAAVEEGAVWEAGGVVMAGAGSVLDASIVDLTYVNPQTKLKPGQRVFTSGLGFFPKGIVIGNIVDISNAGYGLYNEARVKLAANLANLEEVWVVLPQ